MKEKDYFDEKFDVVIDKIDNIADYMQIAAKENEILGDAQSVSNRELCLILKTSIKSLDRARAEGKLKSFKRNGRVRFMIKDVKDYIKNEDIIN